VLEETEKGREKDRERKKEGERHGKALRVLLKRAKTFSRFFPFSLIVARSAKMHPRNCRLERNAAAAARLNSMQQAAPSISATDAGYHSFSTKLPLPWTNGLVKNLRCLPSPQRTSFLLYSPLHRSFLGPPTSDRLPLRN